MPISQGSNLLLDEVIPSSVSNSVIDSDSEEELNTNIKLSRNRRKAALNIVALKSNSDSSLPIYKSCIEASNDPSIILKGKDFGNMFDRSLSNENIFFFNSAFSELIQKSGQVSAVHFKNKIFELQRNIVRPQLQQEEGDNDGEASSRFGRQKNLSSINLTNKSALISRLKLLPSKSASNL